MQVDLKTTHDKPLKNVLAAAEQFSDSLITKYDYEPKRLEAQLIAARQIDPETMSETQLRDELVVLNDLIFDFLPSLATQATNSFTSMISLGLATRDLSRGSSDFQTTLDTFEAYAPEALEQGMQSAKIVKNGRTVDLHKAQGKKPNGLDMMYKKVREGKFSLYFPFPHLDTYDFKRSLDEFSKLRKAFTKLHDFSDQKMDTFMQALLYSGTPNYIESKTLRQDFFEVFRSSTKSLAEIYSFIGEILSKLPDTIDPVLSPLVQEPISPKQKLKNAIASNLLDSMKFNGAAIFRMVANPTKFKAELN